MNIIVKLLHSSFLIIFVKSRYVELAFGNGYLFAELLQKFSQLIAHDCRWPENYHDSDLLEHQISNWSKLQPALRNLGIPLKASDVESIMRNEKGKALRLVYLIKMALDRCSLTQRAAKPPSFQHGAMAGSLKQPNLLTTNFRSSKPKYDKQTSSFFVSKLRSACSIATLERREARYNYFEREKLSQQTLALEMDKLEDERAMEDRENHRKVQLDHLRRNRAFADELLLSGIRDWKDNISKQHDRESLERAFKNRLLLRQRRRVKQARLKKKDEVKGGIEDFEKRLENFDDTYKAPKKKELAVIGGEAAIAPGESSDEEFFSEEEDLREHDGIGSGPLDAPESMLQDIAEGPSSELPPQLETVEVSPKKQTRTQASAGLALLQTQTNMSSDTNLLDSLSKRLPSVEEQKRAADEFLSQIKESKIAGNLARKEREKRRRRYLCDLDREFTEEIEGAYLTQCLSQQLTRPTLEEERLNYRLFKCAQIEKIIVENRENRMSDYHQQRRKNQEHEKKVDDALCEQQLGEMFGPTQNTAARQYRALERGRLARKQCHNTGLVEEIVGDSMIDLLCEAEREQQDTDAEEPDDRVWLAWMHKFVVHGIYPIILKFARESISHYFNSFKPKVNI